MIQKLGIRICCLLLVMGLGSNVFTSTRAVAGSPEPAASPTEGPAVTNMPSTFTTEPSATSSGVPGATGDTGDLIWDDRDLDQIVEDESLFNDSLLGDLWGDIKDAWGSLSDEFYNQNSLWLDDYDGQYNKWLNLLFNKGKMPEESASIIEKAFIFYKL